MCKDINYLFNEMPLYTKETKDTSKKKLKENINMEENDE